MDLLEMKNRLALETVRLIFRNNIDVIFIGGTALNTFYLDYRFSEDLDLGYLENNKKSEIEKLLIASGYATEPTNFKFRDIITFEGTSLKMDVIRHKLKYDGIAENTIDGTKIKTLKLEEFAIEKTISFFTREEVSGMGRDAYDLFSINQKYKIISLIKRTKNLIRKNIISKDHNISLFEENIEIIDAAIRPYLKVEPMEAREVLAFLKRLRQAMI